MRATRVSPHNVVCDTGACKHVLHSHERPGAAGNNEGSIHHGYHHRHPRVSLAGRRLHPHGHVPVAGTDVPAWGHGREGGRPQNRDGGGLPGPRHLDGDGAREGAGQQGAGAAVCL